MKTSDLDDAVVLIARIVPVIPALRTEIDAIHRHGARPGSLAHRSRDVEFAIDGVAQAGLYLAASADALFTFALPSKVSAQEVHLALTTVGTGGLLRQAMEASANACWMLEELTLSGLQERGLASVWVESDQRLKCAQALGLPAPIADAQAHRTRIREDAIRLNLLAQSTNGGKTTWAPIRQKPSAVELLRKTRTPEPILEGLDDDLRSALSRSEWLYRWMSGYAHGYAWPNLATAREISNVVESSEDGVKRTNLSVALIEPNTMILALALVVSYLNICSALASYADIHGVPLDPTRLRPVPAEAFGAKPSQRPGADA